MKLEPGPALDAKVCVALGISPLDSPAHNYRDAICRDCGADRNAKPQPICFARVKSWPAVSSDPACVVMLMDRLYVLAGRCTLYGGGTHWQASPPIHPDRPSCFGSTANLALCALALKLNTQPGATP